VGDLNSTAAMKTIELDDDVYQYLLANIEEIGESASSILRRLLALPDQQGAAHASHHVTPEDAAVDMPAGPAITALLAFLASAETVQWRPAVDRFLRILGFLHAQHPLEFEKVLQIRGRHRIYFSRSRDEVMTSGRRMLSQQVPGSVYWVMTHSSTRQKREILLKVLVLLGYPAEAAEAVLVVLD
jgi:negative modulator of initiation of replication